MSIQIRRGSHALCLIGFFLLLWPAGSVLAASSLLKYPLKHLNITRAGLSNDHVHCEKESCPI